MSNNYSNHGTYGEVVYPPDLRTHHYSKPDLVCFSHLRWDFVHQRPQHLLKRSARDRRVFFIEEPVFDNGSMKLDIQEREGGVRLVVPHLPGGLQSEIAVNALLEEMVQRLLVLKGIREYVLWYYTPMAIPFSSHLEPRAVVYDCMDELSAFKNAPAKLGLLEKELFDRADLVFTGGQSLYEAKRGKHHSVYAFPSSIDREHFMKARQGLAEPDDQETIPHPRLGFFGVIDERFDVELLDSLARTHPTWHFVILGPVVKIDHSALPQHPNIHYLGPKKYDDLPSYISSWDVALLLFANNESTRFISPTKTPEYLAAGKPVVSTPIRDVVSPYGEMRLVDIAEDPEEFGRALERALARSDRSEWLNRVDAFLSSMSWDETWLRMSALIDRVLEQKRPARLPAVSAASQRGMAGI